MQYLNRAAQADLQARMVALADHRRDGSAAEAWLRRVDNLLPAAAISTNEWSRRSRLLRGPTGDPVRYRMEVTPYAAGIQDALDMQGQGVRIVAVQSAARWTKTTSAENKVMKHFHHGPSYNVLWFMQTKDDLSNFVDERFEWMLETHDEVADKIDWSDPKNGRFRKMIGDALILLLPATLRALRAKAAPIIIVDELDAYEKRVRNGILTLVNNRQREFGSNAIAFIASHPDAGPQGVAGIVKLGLIHLWHWQCPTCREASSPCQGAEHRMVWNVPKLLELAEDMELLDLLDMIEREVRLLCPHCGYAVAEQERLKMSNAGCWLQPHQWLSADGTVHGEQKLAEIMGFVGHGFMSPFVNLGKLARAWAAAWLIASNTGDDTMLKEETVKSLGEEYGGADAAEQIESWKVVEARLKSSPQPYALKTVPDGVRFITAFADVQGDRFEVRVIGWDLGVRSWLIDAFAIKEGAGGENIDPANRLRDWEIIEDRVVNQLYPLASTLREGRIVADTLFMPIAKTMVNSAGGAGVSNNARVWMSHLTNPRRRLRAALGTWQVTLFIGAAPKKAEVYPRARQVLHDDAGKTLPHPVFERTINVHHLKLLLARRLRIEEPDTPGRMHLPANLNPRYVRELTSERLINDEWIPQGRNETWDGWVAAEAARALLQPDRAELWQGEQPPDWARPRRREEQDIDAGATTSYYDRLAALYTGTEDGEAL